MAEEEDKNPLPPIIDVRSMGDDTDVIYKTYSSTNKESEEERLKRIAEMFLAKPGNQADRREIADEIKKKDKKLSNRMRKKIAKKNKKKKRAEQKQKSITEATERDDHEIHKPFEAFLEIEVADDKRDDQVVHKPFEAFLEIEVADDKRERAKFPSCFGFIMAWFEKRKEKKLLKKVNADSHSLCVSSSDILIEMISSARANEADYITGNGLKEDVLEIENVESISF
ncbi:uncharacterized protein LOC132748150 [Ruditapes philippinarum]|uniref:uncharacterized protein LOC132748150 n=1 Tax=Ruditapes philippinarum TaxID=129788 RepID=UPI00295AE3E0|nr:uncharacterized protein LOC132748150 [Ruditapes philippinarum]